MKRKSVKWSIERSSPAHARELNAADSEARGYPTLQEMRASSTMKATTMGAVQRWLAPIMLASVVGVTGVANVAHADDPQTPAPPVAPHPIPHPVAGGIRPHQPPPQPQPQPQPPPPPRRTPPSPPRS